MHLIDNINIFRKNKTRQDHFYKKPNKITAFIMKVRNNTHKKKLKQQLKV